MCPRYPTAGRKTLTKKKDCMKEMGKNFIGKEMMIQELKKLMFPAFNTFLNFCLFLVTTPGVFV